MMIKSIDFLKNIVSLNNVDEAIMMDFLRNYFPVEIHIPIGLDSLARIIRIRKNDLEIYNSVDDITYPPAKNAKLNRANKLGTPMFYGTIVESPSDNNYFFTSMLESCSDMFEKDSKKEQIITMGTWNIIKPFHLFALPTINSSFQNDIIARGINNVWISKRKSFDYAEVELMEYIGKVFSMSGNNTIYTITSSIVNHILTINSSLKGVVYPSVKTNGNGICTAIFPTIADTCMKCVRAQMFYYIRNTEKDSTIYPVANSNVSGKEIVWEYIDGWGKERVMNIINLNQGLCLL